MVLRRCVLVMMWVALVVVTGYRTAHAEWRNLGPGIELGTFKTSIKAPVGDSQITVLRIDPERWELRLYCVEDLGESTNLTAKQWCTKYGLAAAINAGMFAKDYRTHVGYMKQGDYVNQSHVNRYQSVAAFGPMREGLPPFRIYDLDSPDGEMQTIIKDYTGVVQNLRLIKRPGENRWHNKNKRWSEAALGEDAQGRVLFLFSRSPYYMRDWNEELLALGIGLVCAQHLEGGPEAQLYIRPPDAESFGSFETSFNENDGNAVAWPVPNVLGLVAKEKP